MPDYGFNRRQVLKGVGGLLAAGTTTTTVAADDPPDDEDGAYGNGNGIGAFLNEEAAFKETPIFTGDIADRRGQEVVDVDVGAMTSIDPPDGLENPPEALPVAFDPLVVKVSPGATVRWTWIPQPVPDGQDPIPHDVTSLVDDDGDPVLEPHGDVRYHSGLRLPSMDAFEVTFEERGNHLYYCTPHGGPFPYHGLPPNSLGMRGAVKVAGKPI